MTKHNPAEPVVGVYLYVDDTGEWTMRLGHVEAFSDERSLELALIMVMAGMRERDMFPATPEPLPGFYL